MMFLLGGVPETIAKGMNADRAVLCRAEGFEPVSRDISGLLLSENKTVQGIYAHLKHLLLLFSAGNLPSAV